MNCRFHPSAAAENLDVVAYYEQQRPGVGAQYLAAVAHAMARIVEAPARSPMSRITDVRRIHLRHFPFAIYDRVARDGIDIVAIAHDRRRPGYWLNRL